MMDALDELRHQVASGDGDESTRMVLADLLEQRGDMVAASDARNRLTMLDAIRGDSLPTLKRRRKVDKMTVAETAKMSGWASTWIAHGLSTERADRPLFEASVKAIYRHMGMAEPPVIWTTAPIVVAFAGPIASYVLANGSVRSAVHSAVRSAVDSAVDSAVHSAVRSAVDSAVGSAVDSAVDSAVGSAVRSAVDSAVRSAVDSAVRSAVDSAVHGRSDDVARVVQDAWFRYLGGQFWPGWYWGSAYVMYMLDVLRLDIGRDLELRARAYAATIQSACWWWPHQRFVIVSERPTSLVKNAQGALKRAAWDGWAVEP